MAAGREHRAKDGSRLRQLARPHGPPPVAAPALRVPSHCSAAAVTHCCSRGTLVASSTKQKAGLMSSRVPIPLLPLSQSEVHGTSQEMDRYLMGSFLKQWRWHI